MDKLGSNGHGDPSSALLEVLDPEQNHAFNDNFVELDYDFSRLEVSSPGVDRKLIKMTDFERFNGEKIKVKLYSPIENQKKYQGKLLGLKENLVQLELDKNKILEAELDNLIDSNLKNNNIKK